MAGFSHQDWISETNPSPALTPPEALRPCMGAAMIGLNNESSGLFAPAVSRVCLIDRSRISWMAESFGNESKDCFGDCAQPVTARVAHKASQR